MYQEQYLTGGNQYSASANEGNSKGRSVNSSLMGEWKVDKSTRVNFSGNFGYTPNQNESNSQSASFDAPPGVNHENLFSDFESVPRDIKVTVVRIGHGRKMNPPRPLGNGSDETPERKRNNSGTEYSEFRFVGK